MKKALMLNTEEKVPLSEFHATLFHKDGEVIELTRNAYTYEDLFESIKEHYEGIDDATINKITIELKR
jgi:RNA:NAD 2'-phosphotransferase (TPT1/KptA family)